MNLSIENFKAIDEKKLELDYKFYLLQGKSGSGKSSILESIKYILYGGSRNIKPLHNKKKTSVSLKYQDILIIRSKNPEQLIIEKEGKKYLNQEAQNIINNKFNTETIWYLSSYIQQNKRNIFIESNSQEKLEILKELIFKEEKDNNLKIFNILDNLSKNLLEKINKTDGTIEYINKDIERIKVENKIYLTIFKEAKSVNNLDNKIDNLEKQFIIYNKQLEFKEKNINLEELKNYPPNLNLELINKWKEYLVYKDSFKDLEIKEYNIKNLNNQLLEYENNLKIIDKYKTNNIEELITHIKNNLDYINYKNKIDKIIKLEEYIKNLKNNEKDLIEKWKLVLKILDYDNIDFDQHQSKIIKENYLEKKKKILNCPKCNTDLFFENNNLKIEKMKITEKNRNFSIDVIDNFNKLLDFQKEANNKLIILKKDIPEKVKSNKNIKFDKNNLEEDLKILYTYKYNIRSEKEIKLDIKNYNLILKYKKLKEFENFDYIIPNNFEEYYQRYLTLKRYEQLNLNIELENDIEENLKKLKLYKDVVYKCSALEKREKDLKEEEKKRKEITQQLEHINRLYKVIKETENHYIEMKIGEINQQLNEILDLLFEDINIEISMFRETKGKEKNKPQVNLNIFLHGIEYPNLNYFSGGEKDRISIALTLTFNIILGSPILMFDEVFSSLEEKKREDCLNIIRKYTKNKIFLNICHETIEGFYDKIIKF